MTLCRRGFLRRLDWLGAPRNLRSRTGEELAGKVGQKKSPTARRSDGDALSRGFRKENKVTRRKHGHRKKVRFSPLALIPCEERKWRIPNLLSEKLYYLLDLYIYLHMFLGPTIHK